MDIYVLPLESLCLKVMGCLSLGMKAKANIKFHGETIIMPHPYISFFFIFFWTFKYGVSKCKKGFGIPFTRIELVFSMFPYLSLALNLQNLRLSCCLLTVQTSFNFFVNYCLLFKYNIRPVKFDIWKISYFLQLK